MREKDRERRKNIKGQLMCHVFVMKYIDENKSVFVMKYIDFH